MTKSSTTSKKLAIVTTTRLLLPERNMVEKCFMTFIILLREIQESEIDCGLCKNWNLSNTRKGDTKQIDALTKRLFLKSLFFIVETSKRCVWFSEFWRDDVEKTKHPHTPNFILGLSVCPHSRYTLNLVLVVHTFNLVQNL